MTGMIEGELISPKSTVNKDYGGLWAAAVGQEKVAELLRRLSISDPRVCLRRSKCKDLLPDNGEGCSGQKRSSRHATILAL
jgi:hypothetical protein